MKQNNDRQTILSEARLHSNGDGWQLLRLVKDTSKSVPQYRIEISHAEKVMEPMELTFLQRLKWLFSKKRYPMVSYYTWKFLEVFVINDTDPGDPYVENCAREVWDYLTKNYDIENP